MAKFAKLLEMEDGGQVLITLSDSEEGEDNVTMTFRTDFEDGVSAKVSTDLPVKRAIEYMDAYTVSNAENFRKNVLAENFRKNVLEAPF